VIVYPNMKRGAAITAATTSPTPPACSSLYKMGRAGYWRLLLDSSDVRALGAGVPDGRGDAGAGSARVEAHAQTLAALARERQELDARTRACAVAAAAGLAGAGGGRARRRGPYSQDCGDRRAARLNAQMTGELEAAQPSGCSAR
jgi:hypothetical protein